MVGAEPLLLNDLCCTAQKKRPANIQADSGVLIEPRLLSVEAIAFSKLLKVALQIARTVSLNDRSGREFARILEDIPLVLDQSEDCLQIIVLN